MAEIVVPVYVTFSDKPLKATEQLVALAGETDDTTSLHDLLVLMYKTWTDAAFQEGLKAEQPRIVLTE